MHVVFFSYAIYLFCTCSTRIISVMVEVNLHLDNATTLIHVNNVFCSVFSMLIYRTKLILIVLFIYITKYSNETSK